MTLCSAVMQKVVRCPKPIIAAVSGTAVTNWWSNGGDQIAFGRGTKGYVAINHEGSTLTRAAIAPFFDRFVGNTAKPRVSVGFGVNWNSPFGPFRIDIAKALLKADGDDTKLITFNVGTAF